MNVLGSRSLVIEKLREDDEGLYWCENCSQNVCRKIQSKVTTVNKGQNNSECHNLLFKGERIKATTRNFHILFILEAPRDKSGVVSIAK